MTMPGVGNRSETMPNALSFDIEEIYHAELVRKHMPPAQRQSAVVAATEPILALLARRNLQATFFVVGDVLREHPAFVRAIAAAGHEVGCHTMSHRPLWEMTPDSLRTELREFRSLWQALWPAAGNAAPPLLGFRAPTFSLVPRTSWALSVLAEEGFAYDSSIFPVANPVYGLNGGPLSAYRPSVRDLRQDDPDGPIIELPMTVWEIAGLRVPVSGGFYLRALPAPVLLHALHTVSKTRPLVIYAHPWEADPASAVVHGLSPSELLITYYNRASVLPKLERILDEFPFAPLGAILKVAV